MQEDFRRETARMLRIAHRYLKVAGDMLDGWLTKRPPDLLRLARGRRQAIYRLAI